MYATLDTYGFALKGMTETEKEHREKCLRRSDSALAAWMKILERRSGRLAGRRMKDMVRRGIPPPLRPNLWMSLSGAKTQKAAHSETYYADLVQRSAGDVRMDSETERKFATNLGREGLTSVGRIFAAFQLHCGGDGGLTGLIPVIAFMLLVMGVDREEDVFWLLDSLLHNKLNHTTNHKFGFWCRVQERSLAALLQKKNPILAEHIEKFASLSKICDGWFSSLFVMTFPSETVARIWDCVFCEGVKVLHRIALITLMRNQNTILSMSHSLHLPKILTYKLRRTFDGSAFLMAAFRSVGSMPSATLRQLSQKAEREIMGET